MYELDFSNRFVRAYKKLDGETRLQVDKVIRVIVENPGHPSLRLKGCKAQKIFGKLA